MLSKYWKYCHQAKVMSVSQKLRSYKNETKHSLESLGITKTVSITLVRYDNTP